MLLLSSCPARAASRFAQVGTIAQVRRRCQ